MFFSPKASGESAPLIAPSNASGNGSSKYYFLANQGHQSSTRDVDGGEVVEGIPEGAAADEFAPKQLGPMVSDSMRDCMTKKTDYADCFRFSTHLPT